MVSPPERGNSYIGAFFEDTETLPQPHKDALRQYFYDERRWVMETMPNMPEDEWLMYVEWVKAAGQPLPRKGTWKKLKSP